MDIFYSTELAGTALSGRVVVVAQFIGTFCRQETIGIDH